jgi:STE24 endopeptidase
MTDAEPLQLPPTPPEVKRYQRQKLLAGLAALALTLAALLTLALLSGPVIDPWLRSWLGDSPWLRLAAVALLCGLAVEAVTLPLHFWSGYVLEHRHGLSNQTLGRWLLRLVKAYLVGGALALPLLYGLYALLRLTYPWWLWAALGWLLVTLVLGRLLPVLILPLFYRVTPLDDPDLRDRLRRLAEGTGLTLEGVYRLHLSADTRKANAALAGLGSTRRVLLGDTLLERFTPEEIEVVFAHEVGHHVHRHLPKLVALSVALALAGFWLVDLVLRAVSGDAACAEPRSLLTGPLGYGAFDDPAGLPLVVLVLTAIGLVLAPLENAISRHFERQCDRYALRRTGAAAAYRSAFIKLAQLNKADPDPHPLVVWLFHDHPPIRKRLALADLG